MADSDSEHIIVHKYPPEMAGEFVGWMDIKNLDEEGAPGVQSVSIAYARISEEGAIHSYRFGSEGEKTVGKEDKRGFEGSVELRVISSLTEVRLRPLRAPGLPNWDEEDMGVIGATFQDSDIDTRGQWVVGDLGILNALRQGLNSSRLAKLYGPIYYNLAYMAEEKNILADPAMHGNITELDEPGATELEEFEAHRYVSKLRDIQVIDKIMLDRLTTLGVMKASSLAKTFKGSRRDVARLESELAEQRADMALKDWYKPVGCDRTWYYMDATQQNEDGSFGKELKALEYNIVVPVQNELRREINELNSRFANAQHVAKKIGTLSLLEEDMLESRPNESPLQT